MAFETVEVRENQMARMRDKAAVVEMDLPMVALKGASKFDSMD